MALLPHARPGPSGGPTLVGINARHTLAAIQATIVILSLRRMTIDVAGVQRTSLRDMLSRVHVLSQVQWTEYRARLHLRRGSGQRQGDPNRGAGAGWALGGDLTSVGADDRLDDRQPEPGAAVLPC